MPEKRNGLTLLRSEDWMAVWLGFVIIAAVLLGRGRHCRDSVGPRTVNLRRRRRKTSRQ